MRLNAFSSVVGATLVLCAGCGAPASQDPAETTGASREALTGTLTEATAYPEAVQLDLPAGICTGSIITPHVVLTAAHCAFAATVTAPYNGHQVLQGSQVATFSDWNGDPSTGHDVGLIFLDSPATLSAAQCPVLAQKPLADGTNVVNLGVRKDGALPTHTVWVDVPHPVQSGANCQWPDDYCTQTAYLEDGDSGGPVETSNSSPHEIVAVNSATTAPQGPTDALARVDLVYSWIAQQIQQHGGPGPCTGTAASSGSDGGAASGSSGSNGAGGSSGGPSSSGGGGGSTGGGTSGGSGSGSSSSGSGGSGGTWNGASGGSGGCAVAPVGKMSDDTALAVGLASMAAAIRRRKPTKSRRVEG